MQPGRLFALSSLALVGAVSCGGPSDPDSTLSTTVDAANPAEVNLASATPSTLFDQLTVAARARARAAYVPPDSVLPAALSAADYDAYRSIRFRPDAALWRGAGRFQIQLFHPGFIYRKPVRIHVVDERGVTDVPFDPEFFSYDGPAAPLASVSAPGMGYAGFRVHYPLNDPAVMDEAAVFQGASYFRLLGRGQVHGMSSRGIAVDVALDEPEEFPDFREFWLVRPAPDADTLVFFALLDGPSLTGAYRFALAPGPSTVLGVDARLFARADVRKLGVAPLTSMFLYGANRARVFDDFRPQVHDSDGLLAHTAAGEWIWRPLSNGPGYKVTSLRDRNPLGFGLAQRDRSFESYLDLETRYDRRPSEWVDAEEGDWGSGVVELVEIESDSEFRDNIVTSWVSDAPFRAGDQRRYRYRLETFGVVPPEEETAHVVRTRMGRASLPGQSDPARAGVRRFVVDFQGGDALRRAGGTVRAVVEASVGRAYGVQAEPLPDGEGWRARFDLEPDGDRPADLRLYLEGEGERLSETWSYVWVPEP